MRNDLLGLRIVAGLILLSVAASTYAHHGIVSWYDTTKSVSLKGTVTSYEWTNPHAYIHIDVKDGKGAIENWAIEMRSVGMLSRFGWRKDSVKIGDQITLIGNPERNGKHAMLLEKAVLANGRELKDGDLVPGAAAGQSKGN
jgi:Family of unknown function (DUF6152)